ncbi:MAG TPA: rubrerythrin family protein [Dehalococcoidales bacterium]|jgi:rubrerythrin
MPNSNDNLQAAFAGESQASRKYLYFAEKADADGQPQIARLFRAASDAETVHARNHLKAMNGIGTVSDNLKAAISGEHYEFTEMYPGFIAQAETEKNAKARNSFDWANEVEQVHHALYQKALQSVQAGKKPENKPIFVCQNCGNTVEGEAPDVCPICGKPRSMFKKID